MQVFPPGSGTVHQVIALESKKTEAPMWLTLARLLSSQQSSQQI
uniref:Uncharacterized protein n=1 Tax=Arundo donax TaxID=35708 RepID=A0A0A9AD82_ARUDO